MKKNVGNIDRMIRVSLALVVGVLYHFGVISGVLAIILSTLALIFIVTSFIGFCPLYYPFRISTRKKTI